MGAAPLIRQVAGPYVEQRDAGSCRRDRETANDKEIETFSVFIGRDLLLLVRPMDMEEEPNWLI